MQVQDLLNALRFLQKTYVGKLEEDVLLDTIKALEKEVAKQNEGSVAS